MKRIIKRFLNQLHKNTSWKINSEHFKYPNSRPKSEHLAEEEHDEEEEVDENLDNKKGSTPSSRCSAIPTAREKAGSEKRVDQIN